MKARTGRSRVRQRLNCIWCKLAGAAPLRHVGIAEVARCCLLRYDGFKKRRVRRALRVEKAGDLVRVSVYGQTIYWFSSDNLTRLIQYYLETFDPGNPHYFESSRTTIATGDVVVDVGGCEGYFALKAAKHASKVVIIEPVKLFARCLRKTFESELVSGRVEVAAIVLGKENKEVLFVDSMDDPGLAHVLRADEDPSLASPVPQRTLDTFVADAGLHRVDFIKVDAEGAELDLIEGGRETIACHHPKIAIACYHRPEHANRIVELICGIAASYRYNLKGIVDFDGVPRPILAHFWHEERG